MKCRKKVYVSFISSALYTVSFTKFVITDIW